MPKLLIKNQVNKESMRSIFSMDSGEATPKILKDEHRLSSELKASRKIELNLSSMINPSFDNTLISELP